MRLCIAGIRPLAISAYRCRKLPLTPADRQGTSPRLQPFRPATRGFRRYAAEPPLPLAETFTVSRGSAQ
ncbi:hypothetical protein [Paenibacillus sp. RC84]|uniref:hypothetical protein n=1 Tax=Paenibacillus sp. RC84 TaxID=3156252 RepID=UPI0035176E8C